MDMRPVLLVANPHSRHGPSVQHEAREALRRHGFTTEVAPWQPERLSDLIRGKASTLAHLIHRLGGSDRC